MRVCLLSLIVIGALHFSAAFSPASLHINHRHGVRRAASAKAGRRSGCRTRLGVHCSAPVFEVLKDAQVLDPSTGTSASILAGLEGKRALVVLAPQLGDFDSAEYAELLSAAGDNLTAAGIELRFVGIGDADAAQKFAAFNALPLECVRVDPNAAIHYRLSLHAGPAWGIPDWAEKILSTQQASTARAWLNYMAMCAGLGSRGTLREILRGYLGDKSAPERLPPSSLVEVGPVRIMGTRRVRLGPIEYDQMWKDERGYQRPVELATVRLRNMKEVLLNWRAYVR
jgi:hypothetical protein